MPRRLWFPSSWGETPAIARRNRSSVEAARQKAPYSSRTKIFEFSKAPLVFAGEFSGHAQAGEDAQSRNHKSPLVATYWALLLPGPPCLPVMLLLSPVYSGLASVPLALGSSCLISTSKGMVLAFRERFPSQVIRHSPAEFPTSKGRERLCRGVSCCEPCSSSRVQCHRVLSITSCIGGRWGIHSGV